jgi:hypothetical protein
MGGSFRGNLSKAGACRDTCCTAAVQQHLSLKFQAAVYTRETNFHPQAQSLHPLHGMSRMTRWILSSAAGARTSVYLASSPDVSGISGQYFYKCKVAKPSDAALDDAAAARLWDVSAEMTGVS